jgi:DGQHR domain-containing protein
MTKDINETLRFSCASVRQGKHVFYSLTMPSEVIASTSLISRRRENPIEGFQRFLDEKRAQEIAEYIDNGGSIPTAIILSAQKEASASIDRNKTFVFSRNPHAFLVLDGQHRVYGFLKANSIIRVPVVVYIGLSLSEEVKIFIDLNTKQRPVPNELLLDIKNLALTENDLEVKMREVFDYFSNESTSPLYGLTSASEKQKGKISRVTFNAAFKPIMRFFDARNTYEIFEIASVFIASTIFGFRENGKEFDISKPTLFSAIISIFPKIADRVASKYIGNHTVDNYLEVMKPIFVNTKSTRLKNSGQSPKELSSTFINFIENNISI